MEGVRGLSNAEVKEMLESIAWRKTWEEWGREMKVKPKLIMLKENHRSGGMGRLCGA